MNSNYNEKPLVSIIIPAYNVEGYVEKCILSTLNQTYDKIEVVVINDGSKDNTPNIIDRIAQNDVRVSVLHKKNEGVSAARNDGIKISKGDYLVFVDADDFISKDYVEYMLNLVKLTNSDFCFSKLCFISRDEKQVEKEHIEKVTPEEATALLLSPNVIVGCWNKIYKRSLIVNNEILFSTTLFYGEGLTFITTLSQISESVGVGNRKVYYYRRNNETSATTKFDINKIYNGEKALKNIKDNLTINDSKVNNIFNLHLCLFVLGAMIKIKYNSQKRKYITDYKRWKKILKINTLKLLFSKDVSIYRKLLLVGGLISPWLMMKLDTIRRKRISNNSVE